MDTEVRNPAGGDPLVVLMRPDAAFLVDKIMPSHKARQQLLYGTYARIVRAYLADNARARHLVDVCNPTLRHCWEVNHDGGMARWMDAARA